MKIITCALSEATTKIEEARNKWIFDIIESLGVSKEVFAGQTIDEFRLKMNKLGIEIELYSNGNVNIYKNTWHEDKLPEKTGWLPVTKDNLIAQWKEPVYTRKMNENSVYYEIHLDMWSSIRKT